jgi:hypothetical protein
MYFCPDYHIPLLLDGFLSSPSSPHLLQLRRQDQEHFPNLTEEDFNLTTNTALILTQIQGLSL